MDAAQCRFLTHILRQALEAGIFFLPAPVREKGRPYYPRVCVLVDHANGMIVSYEMFKDLKNEGYKCIEMLVGFILENGVWNVEDWT